MAKIPRSTTSRPGRHAPEPTELLVREVAERSGVTVRTLHHYDSLGLLVPSSRSSSGYRLYSPSDLERLQQILFYRELGVDLPTIAGLLDDPDHDRLETLREQRRQLLQNRHRLDALLTTIDRAIDRAQRGSNMSDQETRHAFDGFDPSRYEEEVRTRWGDTDAYRISKRRTGTYRPDDWEKFRREEDEIGRCFAELLGNGTEAAASEALQLAERHRCHIDRTYYPCSHAMHAALADLYTGDPRFREHWEQFGDGVAEFVSSAIRANAAANAGQSVGGD